MNVSSSVTPPGMVDLTIDGKPLRVPNGTTVFDAARMNGIHVPTLCHLQNQTPVGVCRLCVVDTGARVLSASCVRPVEPGMKVVTNSDKVLNARRTLLELLMSDHPSPCARQEKSGDCELEALAKAAGIVQPRFPGCSIARGTDDSSLAIAVDHDACILCDRCIRGCDEIKDNFVLGRTGKGYSAGIAFDLNRPMGDSTCISCGECMVSCPTGALTNKTVVPAALPDGQPADCRFLKQLPYFEGISSTFLELNRQAVVVRRFQAGQTIIREGEYGSTAFLILEGQAQLFLQRTATRSGEKPKQDTLLTILAAGLAGKPRDSARPLTRASIPRAAEAVEPPGPVRQRSLAQAQRHAAGVGRQAAPGQHPRLGFPEQHMGGRPNRAVGSRRLGRGQAVAAHADLGGAEGLGAGEAVEARQADAAAGEVPGEGVRGHERHRCVQLERRWHRGRDADL